MPTQKYDPRELVTLTFMVLVVLALGYKCYAQPHQEFLAEVQVCTGGSASQAVWDDCVKAVEANHQ